MVGVQAALAGDGRADRVAAVEVHRGRRRGPASGPRRAGARARDEPLGRAVLGQQVARAEVERALVARPRPRPSRSGSGARRLGERLVELGRSSSNRAGARAGRPRPRARRRGAARATPGSSARSDEIATCSVARRRVAVGVGPERLLQHLAVDRALGVQREQCAAAAGARGSHAPRSSGWPSTDIANAPRQRSGHGRLGPPPAPAAPGSASPHSSATSRRARGTRRRARRSSAASAR